MNDLLPTPTAGYDEPFDLLAACHDRVRRSLDLLQRLVQHLREHGADEQARAAAGDVLRYFNLAAPLHHEDEERHVFPLLRETGDATLIEAAARLHEDHVAMASRWQALAPLLEAAAAGAFDGHVDALADAASAFSRLYDEHLELEDNTVFGIARAVAPPQVQRTMAEEMAARRGVAP